MTMILYLPWWFHDSPSEPFGDEIECCGCGEIFFESELTSGACKTCWDNITRDEDD